MFFRLMEYTFAAVLILMFVTQIVMPVWKGRPMFPFFRNQRKLEKSLADANQAEYEADLAEKVKKSQPRQNGTK